MMEYLRKSIWDVMGIYISMVYLNHGQMEQFCHGVIKPEEQSGQLNEGRTDLALHPETVATPGFLNNF